ncbi:NTE family protein [Evansella caseinilytica]|uniref:NTE family protein n=1 Tax=Evansella caseinilytica TaxID=1503961 RepID=A0A1H3MJD2_9BACI|nr:patatin-like phospholipase family protein [Evansella caseinilytica]SDY76686.1 NTE family protein [Evansella caseinilytica]
MEPTIGLALGSGGSRGFAHIGVLKVLAEEGIEIDYIAGSSMGALVGALFGAGHQAETLEKLALRFRRKYLLDFTVPKMGFIKGDKVKQLVGMLVEQKKLEELALPCAVIATDLLTGEKAVFRHGPVAAAVRASIAIPGIFIPETIGGRVFVDGGVVDRVPVEVVKEMGADIVVAVDVTSFNPQSDIGSIYDVIIQTMDIMEKEMVRYREIKADVMIRPPLSHIKPKQFANVQEIIETGEAEAKKFMPLLKEKIRIWKGRHHENRS